MLFLERGGSVGIVLHKACSAESTETTEDDGSFFVVNPRDQRLDRSAQNVLTPCPDPLSCPLVLTPCPDPLSSHGAIRLIRAVVRLIRVPSVDLCPNVSRC